MKKMIGLFSMFSLVSINLPLVSCFENDRVRKCIERCMTIKQLQFHLGLIDKNCLSNLQPVFDENCNLIVNANELFDFNDKEYLNKTFLDEQNRAKDDFLFHVITCFLKLKPDENERFDLSDILFKVDNITYFKIETKSLPNSNEKTIAFTDGVIRFVFLNKSTNTKIESFYSPAKDMEVDIFNKMFSNNSEEQCNNNKIFSAERDLNVVGFEIGKTLADIKVELSKNTLLVKKIQNIFKNFNFKLDNLIKFVVKLNLTRSDINNSVKLTSLEKRLFKNGDFIDIEFTLSIPNGVFGKGKKNNSTPAEFSITLTKDFYKYV